MRGTESLLIAAQSSDMNTNYDNARIDDTQQNTRGYVESEMKQSIT